MAPEGQKEWNVMFFCCNFKNTRIFASCFLSEVSVRGTICQNIEFRIGEGFSL